MKMRLWNGAGRCMMTVAHGCEYGQERNNALRTEMELLFLMILMFLMRENK